MKNKKNYDEFKEKVVDIGRVAKVVKGGRNFRFTAVVVVGDSKGKVGVGTGKATEVPDAIKKAVDNAKKNIVQVSIDGTTVPHEFIGKFGAAKVLVKRGDEGSGIIAGGSARAVLELAGYRDVTAKVLGTNNPRNVANATLNALSNMRTKQEVQEIRRA